VHECAAAAANWKGTRASKRARGELRDLCFGEIPLEKRDRVVEKCGNGAGARRRRSRSLQTPGMRENISCGKEAAFARYYLPVYEGQGKARRRVLHWAECFCIS
jgi:hypothetical protein